MSKIFIYTKKSLLFDIFFTVSVFALSAGLFFLFYNDVNKITVRQDITQVGNIFFKVNIAERKFSDSLMWERLEKGTSIYSQDVIRTNDNSSAYIIFEDSSRIDLSPNTLLKVSFLNGQKIIDFSGGNITVTGDAPTLVKVGENVISFQKGTGGSITNIDDKVSVNAAGTVIITPKEGAPQVFDSINSAQDIVFEKNGLAQIQERLLSSIVPLAGETFVVFNENSKIITFTWDCTVPKNTRISEMNLILSLDAAFSKGVKIVPVEFGEHVRQKTYSVQIPVDSGVWYWRVDAAFVQDEKPFLQSTFVRSVQVLQDTNPQVYSPIAQSVVWYREKSEVPFLWSKSEYAADYSLQICSLQDFSADIKTYTAKNNLYSLSDLPDGTWYWRVIAQYPFANALTKSSDIGVFEVKKQAQLMPVTLIQPKNKATLLTLEDASFIWGSKQDAGEYEFVLAKKADLSESVLTKTVNSNALILSSAELAQLDESEYFWSIRWKDKSGFQANFAAAQELFLSKAAEEAVLTLPQNEYAVQITELAKMPFVFSANFRNVRNKIEIASDKAFSSVLISQTYPDKVFSGVKLGVGTYYWRVSTESEQKNGETKTIQSNVHSFTVLNELQSVRNIRVVKSANVSAVNNTVEQLPSALTEFAWDSVENAKEYNVVLYDKAKNAVFSSAVKTNNISVNMNNLQNGAYSIEISPFSEATQNVSTRSGSPNSYAFDYRQIQAVSLVAPAQNAVLQETAAQNPVTFTWKYDGALRNSALIIRKNSANGEVVYRKNNPAKTETVRNLAAGNYYWNVSAESQAGLNVSAFGLFSIKALPPVKIEPVVIPPKIESIDLPPALPTLPPVIPSTLTVIPPELESPVLQIPAQHRAFDSQQLINAKSIVFKWDSVPHAESYILRLIQNNTVVYTKENIYGNNFLFMNLPLLNEGQVTWQVTAVKKVSENSVQTSKTVSGNFEINIPQIIVPKITVLGGNK